MIRKLLPAQILLLAAITTGCSLSPYRHPTKETTPPGPKVSTRQDTKPAYREIDAVKEGIYRQYRQWKGTRYTLGGLSKQGIDCSGLIYTTYRDQFGVELPRTTQYQARVGKSVKRSELRAGDLVFFKTGHKVRHVGIYIEDNKFLHASTSKGVMISELNGYYWRDKYRYARRVNLDTNRVPTGK